MFTAKTIEMKDKTNLSKQLNCLINNLIHCLVQTSTKFNKFFTLENKQVCIKTLFVIK